MNPLPLITLITDFGLEDPFVGIMKGVMFSLNSTVKIVDICHNVPPHDVIQAAYQWKVAYSYFPLGTIQVGVVDPGVGGKRKGILAVSERYFYVAPDNGLLTLVEQEDPFDAVYELRNPDLQLSKVSSTFHGRDIFAPVAGHLSRGVSPGDFGPKVKEIERLDLPKPYVDNENNLQGNIIGVDRFGNLLTNVEREQFKQLLGRGNFELIIKGNSITRFQNYYAEQPSLEPFILVNSMDYLEIALTNGQADRRLEAGAGDLFTIRFFE
jgi:S-adenosylmethionine hydrolase